MKTETQNFNYHFNFNEVMDSRNDPNNKYQLAKEAANRDKAIVEENKKNGPPYKPCKRNLTEIFDNVVYEMVFETEHVIIFYGSELCTWLFSRDGDIYPFIWDKINHRPEASGKNIDDFGFHFFEDDSNQIIITLARPGEGG